MEGEKLGLNQMTQAWEAVLVLVSLGPVSSENQTLVGLGLWLTEEESLVELQGEVFLEEVWLKIMVGGARQVEVPQKKEKVGEGQEVALQKREKVGEEQVVALLKTGMEASLVGAQKLVEKEESQVEACQVVVQWKGGQGASLEVAVMEVTLEGALLVEVEASENKEQMEVASTCSPYTGSSCSEMR